MKRFESYLRRCIRPEWADFYVDYGLLKDKLRQFYRRRRQLRRLLSASRNVTVEDFQLLVGDDQLDESSYFRYMDGCSSRVVVDREDAILRISIVERKEFSQILEQEVAKAAVFYANTPLSSIRALIESKDHEKAATELLETIAFCCTNIITFRQLLIRYDAFRRTFDAMPLSEWHLQRSILGVNHPVHALFQLRELNELEKLIIEDMQKKDIPTEHFSMQIESFHYLLEKTNQSLERAVAGHLVFKDRVLAAIRQYFLFGFQSRGLVHEPKALMRGRHLKTEIKVVGKWRETRDFAPRDRARESFMKRLKTMKPENMFPLFLNLLSCFFFMMNNYIIEPSSAYYASALGSSDAYSGIMIGAAPWFAMISAVGYSYWTNYNYKCPIIFAGVLQFIGNLMYANAYTYNSIELCLLGRCITGLGAPRIINRRYVADATPFSLRTAASAAFAMATALGAALGPGMAILLDMFDFEFYLPFLEKQVFNGMTGPGYFMAFNWLIYTTIIIFCFNEPTRAGLDELREREESGVSNAGSKLLYGRNSSTFDERGTTIDDGSGASKQRSLLDRRTSSVLDDDGYDSDGSLEDTSCLSQGSNFVEDSGSVVGDSSKFDCNCSCMKNMTTPVIICMSLIFMKRISLESIVGSTSVVTKNRYGWTIKDVGTLHFVNGIIVIPVSAISGYLSTFYEDRYMAIWFLAITLAGMAFLFDPTDLAYHDNVAYNSHEWWSVGPVRYVTGSLIAFSGIEACESYVASLMSKVVPSALAQGTFNSGLLATLVGTGGRATGDVFITLMGVVYGVRNLLNLLIIPGAGLVSFSIFLIWWNYEALGV